MLGNNRSSHVNLCTVGMLLLCLASSEAFAPPALAQKSPVASKVNAEVNADGIVRKMIRVYQSAQSIQENTEARINLAANTEIYQQSEIKIKQPNLLYLSSEDPKLGTYKVYCNGNTVIVYSGAMNTYTTYTKIASPANFRSIVQTFANAGAFLMGKPIGQMLNAFTFMSANGLPEECSKFRFVKMETVEGRQAVVVTGQANITWLYTLIPLKAANYDRRDITLWIDAKQFVLMKSSCDIQWHAGATKGSNNPAGNIRSTLRFSEVHHNIRLNASLSNKTFDFSPPSQAVEKLSGQ
jgi:outer membrane lipoprotein-sorting protein